MVANGYNVYKNNSVNYASKEQLLLMLLDGTVKFSKVSRQAILDKDVKKAHENLVKTQNIYYELMISLDKDAGEWAKQIYLVYEFINQKLVECNLSKDLKIIDELLPLIIDIRDMWNEVYDKTKSAM